MPLERFVWEPLVIGELLYRTRHGLIDESLHARMGAETTNGDGFGVGWSVAPGEIRSAVLAALSGEAAGFR